MPTSRYPRRPPRLPVIFDTYRHSPIYFVTFTTYNRRPWLSQPSIHAAFLIFIRRAWEEHRVAIGQYVIMPDHLHLLVSGGADFKLGGWVKLLKQMLGKAAEPQPRSRLWQEGFFDHLIRHEEKLASLWEYVQRNPATAGLVATPADWPYQGEFIPLDRTRERAS